MQMPPETLAQTQAGIYAALWSPLTPDAIGPEPGRARRFAVYRNNVQHGLSAALAQRFGVIEQLVGAEFFAAMARVFAARHPPRSPVLIDWGDDFAVFLAQFPPVAHLPWLPEVARLEWARGRAFHAADRRAADPAPLSGADPGALILRLAPSLILFSSPRPAVSIWRAHQSDAPRASLPQGPEYAAILRSQGFEVQVQPLDARQYAALNALAQGVPLASATADTDPTPVLALLLGHGLITAFEETPP